MLSFFRKKNTQVETEGTESTVAADEILNEKDENVDADTEIFTELSFHPSWSLSAEDGYVYRFLNNELSPLKPNQISLSGVELHEEDGKLIAVAFVRNSLSKAITFQNVALLLLDNDKQVIARQEFNLSEIGELPGRSSRPWEFIFPKNSIVKQGYSTEGWSIAFEIKPKHKLDLEESWNSSLSTEDKAKLEKLVDELTPPKHGEVNFMGLQANQRENGDLHVTVLIRNGSPKSISIQQLPLQVFDADGEIVAKGGFQLDNLQVVANTTKPWTFIFPASLVLKENIDLSTWKVATINHQ